MLGHNLKQLSHFPLQRKLTKSKIILAEQNRAGTLIWKIYPNRCIPAFLMPENYTNPGDFLDRLKTEAVISFPVAKKIGTRIRSESGFLPFNEILVIPPR